MRKKLFVIVIILILLLMFMINISFSQSDSIQGLPDTIYGDDWESMDRQMDQGDDNTQEQLPDSEENSNNDDENQHQGNE